MRCCMLPVSALLAFAVAASASAAELRPVLKYRQPGNAFAGSSKTCEIFADRVVITDGFAYGRGPDRRSATYSQVIEGSLGGDVMAIINEAFDGKVLEKPYRIADQGMTLFTAYRADGREVILKGEAGGEVYKNNLSEAAGRLERMIRSICKIPAESNALPAKADPAR